MSSRTAYRRLGAAARGRLIRSAGILIGGTAGGQFIMLLALPVLTRIYTPTEFALLATYVACIGILSAVACLRLDIAIPIPDSSQTAANLLVLALLSCIAVCTFTGAVVLTFPHTLGQLMGQPALVPYLWLIPLGTLLAASYSAFQYWATRSGNFSTIARTKLSQSAAAVSTQVGGQTIAHSPVWLLLGHAMSGGAGALLLARRGVTSGRADIKSVTRRSMAATLVEYSRFPKWSAPEALANTLGTQLPIIIIAAVAVGPEAGFLILALRALQAPTLLVGGAVAQVYLAEAPTHWRNGTISAFTSKALTRLAMAGVGPLVFVGLVAPDLFSLAFGSDWHRAGTFVTMMTPWIILQLLSSPISMVMHVTGRQPAMLLLTVTGMILRVGSLGASAMWFPTLVVPTFITSSTAFYLICLAVFSRCAGIRLGALLQLFRRCALPVAGSALVGISCKILIGAIN